MSKPPRLHGSDIRGAGRLAVEATLGLTRLVETLHHNILRTPSVLGTSTQLPAKGITGFVYKTIRGVTKMVGGGIDLVLSQLAPLLDREHAESSAEREAVLAALNGVLGDHLVASVNPLAIAMQWRRAGHVLPLTRVALRRALPDASGKVLLLIHGLCMNDLQWRRNGHDHGAMLAADAGFTPVYLHYNSGMHISTNGRQFADLIETLLKAWPVPVDELVIVGHSMGGLLARSACRYGELAGHHWPRHLRKIVFLGTPHLGAPLERGGHWIDAVLDASPYTTAFARLGKLRSAGITDLRHASLCDEDWQSCDRSARSQRKPRGLPLPDGVACYAIAASLAAKSGALKERLLGDGLVPLDSALGHDSGGIRDLAIPKSKQWIGHRMNHLDLLDRGQVYAKLRRWLAEDC
ncbi:MAG: hypothetical protein ACREPN_11455 [Rudaea sp.]